MITPTTTLLMTATATSTTVENANQRTFVTHAVPSRCLAYNSSVHQSEALLSHRQQNEQHQFIQHERYIFKKAEEARKLVPTTS